MPYTEDLRQRPGDQLAVFISDEGTRPDTDAKLMHYIASRMCGPIRLDGLRSAKVEGFRKTAYKGFLGRREIATCPLVLRLIIGPCSRGFRRNEQSTSSVNRHRGRLITEVLVKKLSDGENNFILVEITRYLNTDWKAIDGPANGYDSRWRAQ